MFAQVASSDLNLAMADQDKVLYSNLDLNYYIYWKTGLKLKKKKILAASDFLCFFL